MTEVLRRERLVPNIHVLEVAAPEVARRCKPGQFIMLMADERGERIPLTVADWDVDTGSVTSVFMVVGTSTQKLALLETGDELPVYVGPLGKPADIEHFGTVLCTAGCYGIGAIFPIVRALKAAGNSVLTLLDVKASYLLYWEERLKSVSDEVLISSRDSAFACKDYIPKILDDTVGRTRIDRVISIGCTYLMYCCSQATKPHGIKTIVSLNPVMLDGTGMCGACRCTVEGTTRFACVDGPDFDGHAVDWDELFFRRKSYSGDEIQSLCHWENESVTGRR